MFQWFKSAQKKEDTQTRLWSTKVRLGLNANLLKRRRQTAQQIISLSLNVYQTEIAQLKGRVVVESQAGWPGGLTSETPDFLQSRLSVQNCVRGFGSHSCHRRFWTRRDRVFSWYTPPYWNADSRWQSQAKENKNFAESSIADVPVIQKCTKKRRYPDETCETRKYDSVWTQIFWNGRSKLRSRLVVWV